MADIDNCGTLSCSMRVRTLDHVFGWRFQSVVLALLLLPPFLLGLGIFIGELLGIPYGHVHIVLLLSLLLYLYIVHYVLES